MVNIKELDYAQIIWDYMKLEHPPKKVDLMIYPGTIDLLHVEKGVELASYADYHIFTGGIGGRNYNSISPELSGLTEARIMFMRAIEIGLNPNLAILEEEAQNTNQNYKNVKELCNKMKIKVKSVMNPHMPYAGRRDLGTFHKEWPGVEFIFIYPNVPLREYAVQGFQGKKSLSEIIADMIGDFQRTIIFPRQDLGFGFMVPQPDGNPPADVINSYRSLVEAEKGYDEHLLKKDGITREDLRFLDFL